MDTTSTFTGANGKTYDNLDKKYTTQLKKCFASCEPPIKQEFNKISKIMSRAVFNRNELLDITDYVDAHIKKTNNSMRTRKWITFTDEAFNFRPWQCC